MDVGKSKIVWSGNNGCHMSQENVINFGVALHPWFPDSYSILRFPERGKENEFKNLLQIFQSFFFFIKPVWWSTPYIDKVKLREKAYWSISKNYYGEQHSSILENIQCFGYVSMLSIQLTWGEHLPVRNTLINSVFFTFSTKTFVIYTFLSKLS